MKKLAYMSGVAVVLLATTAVSYAKDEKPAAAPAMEKKAAAAAPAPAPAPAPAAKADAAKPAAGAPVPAAKPVAPADAAAKAPPPAEPPKMEPPKPAPEVAEMFKAMQGTWKCTGSASMMDGKSVPMDFNITFKLDLDKFWIVGTFASKKTKANPMVFKFTEYATFDAATKKWVRVMVDNTGGWEQATSTGMANNTMVWEGKAAGMGMSYMTKHTEEVKGPKETHLVGEMTVDGKKWMPMYEATCKK